MASYRIIKIMAGNPNTGFFRVKVGAEGQFLEVNTALVNMFNFESEEELLLKSFSSLYEDPEKRAAFYEKMLRTGHVIREINTYKRRDDTKFIGLESAVLVKDDNNQILYCEGILEDITSLITPFMEKMKRPEDRFNLLFNHGFNIMGVVDSEHRIIDANQAACSSLGYSREELKRLSLRDIHPLDNFPGVAKMIQDVVKDGRAYVKDFPFVKKNGHVIETDGWGVLLEIDGNSYILSSFTDIAEKKKAERALWESEEKYRSMTEAMTDPVYISSSDLLVTYMNAAMIRRVGRNASGEPCFKVIENLDERCPWCVHEKVQQGENVNIEITSTRDGRYFNVSCSPLFHENGSISKMTIYRDVTNEKQTQQALQKAFYEINLLKEQIEIDYTYLREEIKAENNHDIIGQSDAIKIALSKIKQVAPTDTTVLILGETGTGKELIARAVHELSPRKDRVSVKMNCAALPSNLIESELFGHEKGAFTGAQALRTGRFEIAHGSTIFLDEIGELPLEVQAKLLRVIEYGEFERLGSCHTIKVDVRIIAATNRDLEKEVREGRFRADLYYRLNVFPIIISPLRERKEDIPLILKMLLIKLNKKMGKKIEKIPKDVIKTLQDYSWPGNVRELENVIERAVINTKGSVLHLIDRLEGYQDIPFDTRQNKKLIEVECKYIIHMLKEAKWRVDGINGAASKLGINPSTLRSRMKKLGIQKP